jgi:hypothetical protein
MLLTEFGRPDRAWSNAYADASAKQAVLIPERLSLHFVRAGQRWRDL